MTSVLDQLKTSQLNEETKTRKPRADKGVPRGPRASRTTPVGDYDENRAPITVRILMKGETTPIVLGCARRTIENGFQVFFYPSKIDPYRETRCEFAISEISRIEITEARQTYDLTKPQRIPVELDYTPLQEAPKAGPQIYSPRKNRQQPAGDLITRLEQSSGPVKIGADELGGALGVGAAVGGIGDSVV